MRRQESTINKKEDNNSAQAKQINPFMYCKGILDNERYKSRNFSVESNRPIEEHLMKIIFSPAPNSKVTLVKLEANQYEGKTSTAKYIVEQLPEKYPKSLAIYLDVQIHNNNDFKLALFNEIKRKMIMTEYYEDETSFNRAISKAMIGDEDADPDIWLHLLGYYEYLSVVLSNENVSRVLLVIDNQNSDNSSEAIRSINDVLEAVNRINTKPFAVLLPLRPHLAQPYECFSPIATKLITDMESFIIEQFVVFADCVLDDKETIIPTAKWAKINHNSLAEFIREISTNKTIVNIISMLSHNNLRLASLNIKNFLLSDHLPDTAMFRKFFNEQDINLEKETLLQDILICLMPYENDKSTILNMFNSSASTFSNDFQNTMIIMRTLLYVRNHNNVVTFRDLVSSFDRFGYHNKYVKDAMRRCLYHGLLISSYGSDILDCEVDGEIRLSPTGAFYLDDLLCNEHYLLEACKRTPRFVKHLKIRNGRNTLDVFINFLRNEEIKEIDFITRSSQVPERMFLGEMGFVFPGNRFKRVSEYIMKKIEKTYPKGLSTIKFRYPYLYFNLIKK